MPHSVPLAGSVLDTVEPPARKPSKVALVIGWVLTVLIGAMMIVFGTFDILKADFAVEGLAQVGYPAHVIVPLGWVIVACGVIFLIPQTAVLGGLLLTAYMGGAVATHVRMGDPLTMIIPAIVFASIVWTALLLRDSRLRSLLPFRKV